MAKFTEEFQERRLAVNMFASEEEAIKFVLE
jgi:hypothetical protein